MSGTWIFLLAIIAVALVGNLVSDIVLSAANESDDTTSAQSVTLFRQILNTTSASLFIVAVLLIVFNRGSPE